MDSPRASRILMGSIHPGERMATLKKILEAARLIEPVAPPPADAGSGDADIDAIIRRAARAESSASSSASSAPQPMPSAAPAAPQAPAGVEEGLAFADIYARQGLSEAGFPVERLLKLVEGLRTLDPATRRAAIMAMDIADETWSMEQVLADADAKVAALRGHQRQLQGTADAIVHANRERIVALETSRDGRVAELRQQIAALEAQIQDAIGTTAADVAKLHSESEANKAALLRETQRIDAHILNLDELTAQFRAQGQ
jgi:hypothetical protein